jgi:hypothetical protein
MQVIRIVICDGRAKSVQINEVKRNVTTKEIRGMLGTMPKKALAEALGISNERQEAVCET